jgi:hypothetical protein
MTASSLMTQEMAQLEALFADCHADPGVLSALAEELRYRSTPHALRLLVQIKTVLDGPRDATFGQASRNGTECPSSVSL